MELLMEAIMCAAVNTDQNSTALEIQSLAILSPINMNAGTFELFISFIYLGIIFGYNSN